MCSNPAEKKAAEILINARMPEIVSESLQTNNDELLPSIKRALLETIVSGTANQKNEVIQYVECFLSNRSQSNNSTSYEKYLKWLNLNKFIDIVKLKEDGQDSLIECYKPTQLGYAVVGSAMVIISFKIEFKRFFLFVQLA